MLTLVHLCTAAAQVEFEHPVDAKGNIEVWLQRLVDGMQDTVKQIIKRAVRNVYVSGGSYCWLALRTWLQHCLLHLT